MEYKFVGKLIDFQITADVTIINVDEGSGAVPFVLQDALDPMLLKSCIQKEQPIEVAGNFDLGDVTAHLENGGLPADKVQLTLDSGAMPLAPVNRTAGPTIEPDSATVQQGFNTIAEPNEPKKPSDLASSYWDHVDEALDGKAKNKVGVPATKPAATTATVADDHDYVRSMADEVNAGNIEITPEQLEDDKTDETPVHTQEFDENGNIVNDDQDDEVFEEESDDSGAFQL